MTIYSRNIPFLFDFYLSNAEPTQARRGRLVDCLPHRGGTTLYAGRWSLCVDIHALRWALNRSLKTAA